MARIGTIANLEFDGTYDILIFEFPEGYPNGALKLAFGNVPRRCTGVQKVAQVFTYCLFTTKGSDPIRPNFGTEFVVDVMSSNISRDIESTHREALESIEDAEAQVRIILNTNNRDLASQLESARLVQIDTTDDGITVMIKITTRAGETAAVAVPFPQTTLEFN